MASIKDKKRVARILSKLGRISLGNLGDCKTIGMGVSEFRLAFGPDYRIYFGQEGKTIILLLLGGDKSTQKKDIQKAITYWQDYLMRKNHDS